MTAKKKKVKRNLIKEFELVWGKRPDSRQTDEINDEITDLHDELNRVRYLKDRCETWDTAYDAFTQGVMKGRIYEMEDKS